ncbi:MAG: hypothetical protein HOC20_12595 [Chloroflexi bacterium]|jgi:hypothetical protein|nr:hypothetical protein [Chloroflexota bacterium]
MSIVRRMFIEGDNKLATSSNADTNLTFRDITAADAQALCDCVKTCYGDTYFVEEFSDPEKLADLVRRKMIHSQIAVTPTGQVVGHLGLSLERADDTTADTLAAMVVPEYRGHRILLELGMQLGKTYEKLNLVGLQLYAIAVHSIVQGHSTDAGGVETGILLGHFPPDMEIEGFPNAYDGRRIAAVLLYFPLHPAPPQTIYIPERYQKIIDSVYSRLKQDRAIQISTYQPLIEKTIATIDKKPRQGTARIRIDAVGRNLIETVAAFKDTSRSAFPVLYVDLPLADPSSAGFVEGLRSLGFFYAGIVLERSGSDILRMQCMNRNYINPEAIVLARPHGKNLLEFILSDRS